MEWNYYIFIRAVLRRSWNYAVQMWCCEKLIRQVPENEAQPALALRRGYCPDRDERQQGCPVLHPGLQLSLVADLGLFVLGMFWPNYESSNVQLTV